MCVDGRVGCEQHLFVHSPGATRQRLQYVVPAHDLFLDLLGLCFKVKHGVKGDTQDFWVLDGWHLCAVDENRELFVDFIGPGGEDGGTGFRGGR